MKRLYLLAIPFILLACEKNKDAEPEMEYRDLQNRQVKYDQEGVQAIDIDNDNTADFLFVAGAVAGNGQQSITFQVSRNSQTRHRLYVLHEEAKDYYVTPALSKGDAITPKNEGGYQWEIAYPGVLTVKVYVSSNNQTTWEGPWKEAQHKYLPIQIIKNNAYHNGWIEISVDQTNEKIILHRAAFSKEAEKDVKAGE